LLSFVKTLNDHGVTSQKDDLKRIALVPLRIILQGRVYFRMNGLKICGIGPGKLIGRDPKGDTRING
jgi:hypothetical protein